MNKERLCKRNLPDRIHEKMGILLVDTDKSHSMLTFC